MSFLKYYQGANPSVEEKKLQQQKYEERRPDRKFLDKNMYTEKHFDRLYTILQKNGGTDTKAMGQTEPHFLSDPMSDRKKFSPTL